MDREDIIRMAREACDQASREDWNSTAWVFGDETLERFATLVAAAEREACAKVCDEKVDAEYKTGKVDHNEMAWTQACAIAIRARGEQ
jgi:putative NIF3 family GTP cyclohydrolase 1 type 2